MENTNQSMKRTGFYHLHQKLGAKIVPFAGWEMPVQYTSIIEEHRRVRNSVGVFDVSHMGEVEIWGENALDFIQKITINDASKLSVNQIQYSAMCYPDGGMVDDLLVYRFADHWMLVINAGNTPKDIAWMKEHLTAGVELRDKTDGTSLLAIQGKKAEPLLQKLTGIDLSKLKYYWFVEGKLGGIQMIISRTGYTGEPGYEIYFDVKHSEKIWNLIIDTGKEYDIQPIGLGARDTLRLEKKMCLYGNDIDQTTNPLEAGLGWITKLDKGNFIGRESLQKIKSEGIKRTLIGFEIEGKNLARHGFDIDKGGKKIGVVTSGTLSPSLEKGIGLGYVDKAFSTEGTTFEIMVRDKSIKATVVKTPFL
jgi:aminomethyltransferase